HSRVEDPLGDHMNAGQGLLGFGIHDGAVDRRRGVRVRLTPAKTWRQDDRHGGEGAHDHGDAPPPDHPTTNHGPSTLMRCALAHGACDQPHAGALYSPAIRQTPSASRRKWTMTPSVTPSCTRAVVPVA